MKKVIKSNHQLLILAKCVILYFLLNPTIVHAQSDRQWLYDTMQLDTIHWRYPKYYFTEYYDTCRWFHKPEDYRIDTIMDVHFESRGSEVTSTESVRVSAFPQHTDNPLVAKGIVFMVSNVPYAPNPWNNSHNVIMSNEKLPEYVYLMNYDATRFPRIVAVDSIRWDTLHPKVIELPRVADTSFLPPMYTIIYEAMFEHPHVLNGDFWLGGSWNSNIRWNNISGYWTYFPTFYVGPCYHHHGYSTHRTQCAEGYGGGDRSGYWFFNDFTMFSPFGIVTDLTEVVATADSTHGSIIGNGFYPDSTYQTLTAIPRATYKFTHWNDGDTTNPRTIFVTHDTAFTAYFEHLPRHIVETHSSDPMMGTVEGGGEYFEEERVTLTAIPANDTIRFSHWNDNVTTNPRQFTLRSDTSFTAHFSSTTVGIEPVNGMHQFTISPNPTGGKATISRTSNLNESGVVKVIDLTGKELMRMDVAPYVLTTEINLSGVPSGAYFVTLVTPTASGTQKLVVK